MAAGLVDAAILQLAVATILRRNRGVSLPGSCAPEFQLGAGGLYPYIFQIGFTWSNGSSISRNSAPLVDLSWTWGCGWIASTLQAIRLHVRSWAIPTRRRELLTTVCIDGILTLGRKVSGSSN